MLYTHYCTVGKYSLINPSPLCDFFGGGVFWHEQLIKFFLASTCDFSSLPPYYSQLSSQPSYLNDVSTSPVIILGALDFQFSFFLFFRAGYSLQYEYTIYLYVPITLFSDTQKREREQEKKETKKTSFLVSAVFEPKHTYIHTSLPPYVHTYRRFQPPVRIQKSIVYLPTYLRLPTYLPNLPRPR